MPPHVCKYYPVINVVIVHKNVFKNDKSLNKFICDAWRNPMNGRTFQIDIAKLKFAPSKANWFSPATGKQQPVEGFQ